MAFCFTGLLIQCSSQKILLEGQSGPYNPFLGARYFKKGPMYQYLSNMQKRRSSWKVKEMKMAVYLKLICFHLLILNCFVSIHFFVTSEKKLLIDLEDAFVRFILFQDAMMDTHELLRYYKSQVKA